MEEEKGKYLMSFDLVATITYLLVSMDGVGHSQILSW